MRHLHLVVVVLGILWAASCSSTSNTTSNPQPTRNTEKFSVSSEDGGGTFSPVLDVKESGDTTTVTVTAQDASDLSEAFLHLNYDESKYTPTDVQFGDFLGGESEVITLAVTDLAGDVPMGVVQTTVGGAVPKDGAGVIAIVTFSNTPFTSGRSVSTFPKGTGNKVGDLDIVGQSGLTVDLYWTERNKGDYDNNGIVGLSDLSPLGKFLNVSVASSADPIHMAMIDGDGNGEINVADLSPLGANLNNQITGYKVYSDAAGMVEVAFVARPGTVDPKRPVEYNYTAPTAGGEQFVVRGVGTTPVETGMESNVAEITIVPGPPNAPSGLQTTVGATVGSLKVRLSWTASDSTDVKGYMVQRKLTSDPPASFADITVDPINATLYTDQTGLTDADYDYQVRAVDKETPALESGYSNTAMGHPYVQVISPPLNVLATTDSGPSGVHIAWDEPLDGSAERYTVFQKGPGEPDFTELGSTINSSIREWTASGLNEGESYEFFVTSRDAFLTLSSVESNHSSADASAALILAVLSVTTDKTTHYKGGGEAASNIVATANTGSATWTWAATQGSVTGSSSNVTWVPPAGATVGPVTITATAHFGPQLASMDVKLYLTNETIKTSYGNNGKFIEWAGSASVLQPTAPFRPLSYYVGNGDKVIIYDWWVIWCYWCKRGFPNVRFMTEYYSDFFYVGENNSGESTATVTSYFASPTFTAENPPHPGMNLQGWESYQGTDPNWTGAYGRSGYPTAIVFDRDGYIRLQHSGAILDGLPYGPQELSQLVSELTGQTPPLTTDWDDY